MTPRAWLGLGLALGALGCNVLTPPVARTVNGVTTEGRFIEPDAYALYAQAALREARGQWSDALATYERALEIDGRGPELRTRIGALACRLRQDALADRAFAEAERLDPEYGPLWFELSQCHRARGALEAAQDAALKAVRLDPERYEATLLAADMSEQRGNTQLAWQLRDALLTHAPRSIQALRAIAAAAARSSDPGRKARVTEALAALERQPTTSAAPGTDGALRALTQGNLPAAKQAAARLLGADPSNGDALIVALCVADLEQDHAGFDALLASATDPTTLPSAQALKVLASLLGRRVSATAGRALQP